MDQQNPPTIEFENGLYKTQFDLSVSQTPSISMNLTLINCLRPVIRLAKLSALFPIHIHKDGSAQHGWFTKENIYCLIFLMATIGLSSVYIPFLKNTMMYIGGYGVLLEYPAQVVFLSGQYITGLIIQFLIHLMSPNLAKAWNDLRSIVSFIGTFDGQKSDLKWVSTVCNVQVFLWVIFIVSFSTFYIHYAWPYIDWKFEGINPLLIIYLLGFTTFCMHMSAHLIHTWIFLNFFWILRICLKIFREVAPTQIKNFESFVKFYKIYSAIEDLSHRLSSIYGFYLILQILLMMISTLVNLYFVIYMNEGFRKGITLSLGPPLMVIIYIGWLLALCNQGEKFQIQAKRAMKSLSEAASFNLTPECNAKAIGLLINSSGRPVNLSAANFVRINRRLMTKVIAVMTTYLIFLVQFKVDLSNEQDYYDEHDPSESTIYSV